MAFDQRQSRHGVTSELSRPESTPGKRTLAESVPVQRRAHDDGATADVHEAAARGLQGSAQPLPHLDLIQRCFGAHDVRGVRAHVGGAAAGAASDMGASAYATGDATAFASTPDLHTAAHEAAHVVQQRGGVQLQGGVGAGGDRYEQHADAVADLVTQGRSAEALLDQGRSGGATQRAVQRFSQPILSPAPPRTTTIRQFIALVQAEEARWPVPEQTQTATMISRLRKIFYGTPGWETKLIPGAASVASGYTIGEEETGRAHVPAIGLPGFDMVRTRQTVTDSAGKTPAIASQQEVQLEDGSFCDIGHVFAGLDAHNHPTAVAAPLNVAVVNDNIGAVTWTGDLGSVLAEAVIASVTAGRLLTDPETQTIVNEYASPQDMLGNIDAYAMASAFNVSNTGGRKVSDLLSEFYLGVAAPVGPNTAGVDARLHRYSRFCTSVGLVGWSGSAFSNEAAWADRWSREVGAAAALYIGAGAERTILSVPAIGAAVVGIQMNPMARVLTEKFLAALKPLVAAEPP